MDIQGVKPPFVVLSAHPGRYKDDPKTISEGFINAMNRFGKDINCLGHLDCSTFAKYIDYERVVKKANELGIPIELNAMNMIEKGKFSVEHTHLMLKHADTVMVNSDAHNLHELSSRKVAFDFLKAHGYSSEGNL